MTLPTVSFLDSPHALDTGDILVVGLQKTDNRAVVHAPGLDNDTREALTLLAAAIDADGSLDSAWRQGPPASLRVRSVVFTGLGDEEIIQKIFLLSLMVEVLAW